MRALTLPMGPLNQDPGQHTFKRSAFDMDPHVVLVEDVHHHNVNGVARGMGQHVVLV